FFVRDVGQYKNLVGESEIVGKPFQLWGQVIQRVVARQYQQRVVFLSAQAARKREQQRERVELRCDIEAAQVEKNDPAFRDFPAPPAIPLVARSVERGVYAQRDHGQLHLPAQLYSRLRLDPLAYSFDDLFNRRAPRMARTDQAVVSIQVSEER